MFKLGDLVEWTSQAQGFSKKKFGQIAQVVEPGNMPDRDRFLSLYRGSGCGSPRNKESYVVMVGRKPYWPRASKLELQG